MRKIMLTVIATGLFQLAAFAGPINISSSWATDKCSLETVPTQVSSAGGTNASVSFHLNLPSSHPTKAGGLYSQFGAIALGSDAGSSITFTFTASVTDTNGAAYDMDRSFIFGLIGTGNAKLWLSPDVGTATGTKVDYGYDFTALNLGAGAFFRGTGTASTTLDTGSVFALGAGASADTTYTMSLVRQADGTAVYTVSQAKTGSDWSTVPYTFTKAEADAIVLDSIFFGQKANGLDEPELVFSMTDISVDIVPYPYATISDTWATDKCSLETVPTQVSGTGGGFASVSFHLDLPSSHPTKAGGVYSQFDAVTLGSTEGDSITLSFTASVADTNGAAYNMNQSFIFGLIGTDNAKLWTSPDTGTAAGTKFGFGYDFTALNLGGGAFFRGTGTYTSTLDAGSVFTLGAGPDADTIYTMSLTRQADGTAVYVVSQTKTDNNWSSVPYTFTKAEADAIVLDSVFFGQKANGLDEPELAFSMTGVSLAIVEAPLPPGYLGWTEQWGGTNVIGSSTNDYDGDGLSNLYEYGLGGNPTNALDRGTSPQYGIVEQGGTNYFGYVYPQLSDPESGLNYSLEVCTNLVAGAWTNAGYTVSGTNFTGETLNMVSNYTDTVDSQKFIRLIIIDLNSNE